MRHIESVSRIFWHPMLLYWCRKQLLFQRYLTKRNVSCIFHFPATRRLEKRGFDGHPYVYFSKIKYISRFPENVYPGWAFCIYRFFWDALLGKNEVLQMDSVAIIICHDRVEKSALQFQKQFLFLVFRASNFSTFLYSHILLLSEHGLLP
jgi:hypothetical protein